MTGCKCLAKVRGDMGKAIGEVFGPVSHNDCRTIVTMYASHKAADIKAHHITTPQHVAVGNTVTNNIIDTGTNALGETGIVEGARIGPG
eukprot:scaffold303991_cov48-Attheya_sp.AAC.1